MQLAKKLWKSLAWDGFTTIRGFSTGETVEKDGRCAAPIVADSAAGA
jgi:hypothetical protein